MSTQDEMAAKAGVTETVRVVTSPPKCSSCTEPLTDGGVKDGDELLCFECGGETLMEPAPTRPSSHEQCDAEITRLKAELDCTRKERDAYREERAFGGVIVRTDSPSATFAELERLANEARETYGSMWKCLQCHTVVSEEYSPAKCVVCLQRIWRRPETLSNGQLVHDFCRAESEGGAEK